MKRVRNYNLRQVEDTLKMKTWWAMVAILPLARRLTLFISNYTDITPNAITLFSFGLRLVSAFFFLYGYGAYLIVGAVIFELAYVFDCVDGSVARLRGMTSQMGCFVDHVTDAFGVTVNLFALALGQGILYTPAAVLVIVLYVFLHFMTFVAERIFVEERRRIGSEKIELFPEKNAEKKDLFAKAPEYINAYRNFFTRRNMKAFFSLPDFEALTCFIFPVFGTVWGGFRAGLYFLLVIFAYKIFSYIYTIKVYESRGTK